MDVGSFARAKAAHAVLFKESNKLTDVLNRSKLSYGQLLTVISAGSPLILDAAGALGALTASLGAATAGLGALAVGVGGVIATGFGGIASIAAPAIGSLGDLITAQEAANKAQTTGAAGAARAATASAQQIRAAQEQVAAATRGVADAEEDLQAAQRSSQLAQEALTAAREEATRQLQDMRRAAVEGETSEERARLSLRQARANLRDVQADAASSGLDLADAELSIVEARQNLRDVTIDSQRAQQDFNEAQRGGISQMEGVVSAQQSLDQAMQGVEDAEEGVADAHREVASALQNLAQQQREANAAAAAGGTSLAALALAQKKAGPEAVKFAGNLKDMQQRWRRLTAEGRNDFFGLLGDGVDRLNQKLPLLARSANTSMGVLRSGFNQFLDRATGPEFNHFINVMTRTFARSMPAVSRAFGNIAVVLERIAVAVAPDIVRMARGFEDMTKGWVESTRNARDLRETIHGLVTQTESWWKLLVAAKDLIVAVLVPGMGQGQKAVKGMTDQLREWTKWVNAHPQEIRNFFKEALETTKLLAQTLLSFLPSLFQISVAMRPIARAFLGILKGLNSLKIGNVSALTGLLTVFVGYKLIRGIQGITAAFVAMRTAALGAATASAAATAASAVPLGAGTRATTATGRAIGSTATVGGGIAGGVARGGAATGRLATIGRGAAGLLGFGGAGAAAIASAAVPIAAIAGSMKLIDETGVLDAGGAVSKTPLGSVLGIGDKSLEDKAGSLAKVADAFNELDQVQDLGNIRRLVGTLEEAEEQGLDMGDSLERLQGTLGGLATQVHDGASVMRHLNRELGNLTTKEPREAIDKLREKYGGLVSAGHDMSRKQRAAFVNMIRTAREHGLVSENQLERVTQAMDHNTAKWERSIRKAARVTGESTESMRESVHGMTVRVSKNIDGFVEITGGGLQLLTTNARRALEGVGMGKQIKRWSLAKRNNPAGLAGRSGPQKGGGPFEFTGGSMLVPGQGSGDKVPLAAMVEPGERLFVLNRNATGFLDWLKGVNAAVPRFQGGGVLGLQGGGYAGLQPGITGLMRKVIKNFGGFISSGLRPGDGGHHGQGMAADWVGGDWAGAAKYSNRIGSQLLEGIYTGALGGPQVSWQSGQQVSPSFWGSDWAPHADHIHLAVSGAIKGAVGAFAKKIKRVILEGGESNRLRSYGQAHLDETWKGLNEFIGRQSGAGAVGDVAVGPGALSKAEVRRLLQAHNLPPIMGWVAMAESLLNPQARNPSGASGLWQIMMPLHQGIVQGNVFDPNVNAAAAATLYRQSGLVPWEESRTKGAIPGGWSTKMGQRFQRGGFLGSFHSGGRVFKDGLGLLQAGEKIIPRMQQGGLIDQPSLSDLKKHIRNLARKLDDLHRFQRRHPWVTGDRLRELRQRGRSLETRIDDPDTSRKERLKLEDRLKDTRRDQERLMNRLQHIRKREERLLQERGGLKELVPALKELKGEIKEHNQLYKEVGVNERAALEILASSVSRSQGQRRAAIARQGAAGITRRQ